MFPTLIAALMVVHIAAGMTALASGPSAMMVRKGLAAHRVSGRVYFYAMIGVAVTAIVLSAVKSNFFLLLVGLFSLQLVAGGYRALSLKSLHLGQRPSILDWLFHVGSVGVGLVLTIRGVLQLAQGNGFGYVGLAFGMIMALVAGRAIVQFIRLPTNPRHWLITHLAGMSAGYIAALTAFVVVNFSFNPGWVLWLLPTAVGTPLILINVGRIRRGQLKFVTREPAPASPAS
jgi:uncharacterized membrane protein